MRLEVTYQTEGDGAQPWGDPDQPIIEAARGYGGGDAKHIGSGTALWTGERDLVFEFEDEDAMRAAQDRIASRFHFVTVRVVASVEPT